MIRVKKAANSAGALNGRRSIRWGKYKLPRDRDEKGNAITEDPMVLDMHKNRPTNLFFRASITKEKRVELAAQKKIRDDFKNSDRYARSLEKRKQMYETRVSYGKIRNFVSCEVAAKEKKEREEGEREKEEERKKALASASGALNSSRPAVPTPAYFSFNPDGTRKEDIVTETPAVDEKKSIFGIAKADEKQFRAYTGSGSY